MGCSRGQSSTEYLSNYTIAGIVVIIVLIALSYLGVWNMLFPDQLPICIFQKGLDCDSYYITYGQDMVSMKVYNQFEDSIVISGVLCSAESVDPSTALPYGKTWNQAPLPAQQPKVNGVQLPQVPANQPLVLPNEAFDIEVYCYTKEGNGVGSLSGQDRYAGLVFLQYRLNSSPSLFTHMIHGNLQGRPQ